jgi:hypothetical protein
MRRKQGSWTCLLRSRGCRHLGSTSTQSSCNFYLIEIPPGRNAKPKARVSLFSIVMAWVLTHSHLCPLWKAISPGGAVNARHGRLCASPLYPVAFRRSSQPVVPVFRVDGHGTVFANGGFRPFGADFAESVAVKGSAEQYAPGDLLVIDASGERRLSLSQAPYSTLVAGIYSTKPGVVASTHRVDEALPNSEVPLAVVGIVPCKVSAENGPIQAGDLLVTSATPGHAMKGTDRSLMLGAVVGKALEPLQKGTGVT